MAGVWLAACWIGHFSLMFVSEAVYHEPGMLLYRRVIIVLASAGFLLLLLAAQWVEHVTGRERGPLRAGRADRGERTKGQ